MKTKILSSVDIKSAMNSLHDAEDKDKGSLVNFVIGLLKNVLGSNITNVSFEKGSTTLKFMCKGKYISLSADNNNVNCKYIK